MVYFMGVFNKAYTAYYDMLYEGKDYNAESNYVAGLLEDEGITGGTLLDVGCGTGRHLSFMIKRGFSVSGVDLSAEMLAKARLLLGNSAELRHASFSDFSFSNKFTAITSLFHVVSYINKTTDVVMSFKNVSKHLIRGGVFVFDFWHGAGCLTDVPTIRILRREDEKYSLLRISEPVMKAHINVVDVNFEILLTEKDTNKISIIREMHAMRYFFLPELEYYLESAGLKIKHSYRWMTKEILDCNAWYGVVVAKKE